MPSGKQKLRSSARGLARRRDCFIRVQFGFIELYWVRCCLEVILIIREVGRSSYLPSLRAHTRLDAGHPPRCCAGCASVASFAPPSLPPLNPLGSSGSTCRQPVLKSGVAKRSQPPQRPAGLHSCLPANRGDFPDPLKFGGFSTRKYGVDAAFFISAC